MHSLTPEKLILKQLDGGLIIRRGTLQDTDALVEFNAHVQADPPTFEPDIRVGAWTRDLFTNPPPGFHPEDFTIVEDPSAGKIVSSLCLISQTWSYAGIPIKVGRPELVGTDAAYRHRGLIRDQFEIMHAWSQERGELVQAITGIPFYYRLFGYEMCVDLGGLRAGFETQVPKLKEGEEEPYQIRAAVPSDLPWIDALYGSSNQRYLLSCLHDQASWLYELNGKSDLNVNRKQICVIQDVGGNRVGYLVLPTELWGGEYQVAMQYELSPDVSWLAVTPSVIRFLWQTGKAVEAETGKHCSGFGFSMNLNHPVYRWIDHMLPVQRPPYAWYLRVDNIPALLRTIAPVLEKRLVAGGLPGYTGEITISNYRSEIGMRFQAGSLVEVLENPWGNYYAADAAFPGTTFNHLLFGYRGINELRAVNPDISVKPDKKPIIETLFPLLP
ncbi:MAG: GNAT family N-acetyltransferase, partial [Anaerolineaceae bacterium]|nr:GNAT family N-acetyltransferase [Anaerolineaceae bacterium]